MTSANIKNLHLGLNFTLPGSRIVSKTWLSHYCYFLPIGGNLSPIFQFHRLLSACSINVASKDKRPQLRTSLRRICSRGRSAAHLAKKSTCRRLERASSFNPLEELRESFSNVWQFEPPKYIDSYHVQHCRIFESTKSGAKDGYNNNNI